MDKVNFDAWTGNTVMEDGRICEQKAQQIIATLGDDRPEQARQSGQLSPLWLRSSLLAKQFPKFRFFELK